MRVTYPTHLIRLDMISGDEYKLCRFSLYMSGHNDSIYYGVLKVYSLYYTISIFIQSFKWLYVSV
jgi:hypothetical protein